MERRNTLQRELTLKTVRKLHGHYTADEIYAAMEKEYPTVSRATVYRNLNVLAEEGEILRVPIADGADRFDFTIKDHYHLLCVGCDKVFDVDMDVIPDVKQKIKDAHGFELLDYSIIFKGICPDCRKKESIK